MKNLNQMITTLGDKGREIVKARLAMIDGTRNMLNSLAVDAEDNFSVQDLSVSGVGDVIREFKVALSANSGIPQSILFGESIAGLGDHGSSEQATYRAMVERIQSMQLAEPMERMMTLVYAQRGMVAPARWSVQFNVPWKPSDAEQAALEKTEADTRKVNADTASVLIVESIIDADEARKWLREEHPEMQIPDTPAPAPIEPEPMPNPTPGGGAPGAAGGVGSVRPGANGSASATN
jgi:phage-related protein (TIGR01555 family)